MTQEPIVTQIISPPNNLLMAIKAYINLITKNEPLIPGPGVSKAFALMNGVNSFNDEAMVAIAAKAERMNLIPKNLTSVMNFCIAKNCKIYADALVDMINDRIISISNGDIVNPAPRLHYNPISARRYYYTPPVALLERIQRALLNNAYRNPWETNPDEGGCTLTDVCTDALLLLNQMEMNEGRNYPNQTAFGKLNSVVLMLRNVTLDESRYLVQDLDYTKRIRPALTILWVIAKLMYGDLATNPLPKDINLADVSESITMCDGTLASIPFPTRKTIEMFNEYGREKLSIKGRTYLAAVSGAEFYKGSRNKTDYE